MEAKRVFGEGRLCNNKGCNLRLAIKEEGIEIDGKVYHQKCNPLKEPRQVIRFTGEGPVKLYVH